MTQLRYIAPDLRQSLDPDEPLLRTEIHDKPWSEWDKSHNAEAVLEVLLGPNDTSTPKYTQVTRNGKTYRISSKHPSLLLKQPDPGSFYVTWMDDDEYVPYNGDDPCDYTLSHCGGNPFYIPLACVTDTETTFRIASTFLRDLSRDGCVNWVKWHDLDLPDEWF